MLKIFNLIKLRETMKVIAAVNPSESGPSRVKSRAKSRMVWPHMLD